ncbi:MAG: hypothetical protein R3B91_04950 [Planctomycetaceae bacterium]
MTDQRAAEVLVSSRRVLVRPEFRLAQLKPTWRLVLQTVQRC